MLYQIEDLQIPGRLFAEGATFTSKNDILLQLLDYHSIDYDGGENYNSIYDYVESNFVTNKARLEWVLDYGQWKIIEYKETKSKMMKVK